MGRYFIFKNRLLLIVGIYLLSSCARSLHQQKEMNSFVYQRSFFCSDARYYVLINFDKFRDLIRVMSTHFGVMRSLPFRILRHRTKNLLFYSTEKVYNFLLQGEFPKHLTDGLLSRHPSWTKLGLGTDGYGHYNSRWNVGLPESHVMFLTTDDLNKLYQRCHLSWQDFLPSTVISKFEQYPFIVYYPKGDTIFESAKKEFNNWPTFSLLISIFAISKGKYLMTSEFLFQSDDLSSQFQADLERIFTDHKNSFDGGNKVFSLLKFKQEYKKLFLVATYDSAQMLQLSEIILQFFRFEFPSILKLLS